MALTASLVTAAVWHKRFFPRIHAFTYAVYYVTLPIDDPYRATHALFSINKWNIWSVQLKDHGPRDGSAWAPWIHDMLSAHHLRAVCNGDIELMTHPRLLGYAFNPISFWFCRDTNGLLRAVLCEVRNTFGDRQNYLVAHPDGRPLKNDDVLEGAKAMHVSPFNVVEGTYRFSFAIDETRIRVNIDYYVDGERKVATALSGERTPLSNNSLLRAFFRYPLMTFKVIFGIHYEAAKLWVLRKLPYRTYAPHTEETVARVSEAPTPPKHTV